MMSCHDLGLLPDVGHTDIWPSVVDRLEATWGRDAGIAVPTPARTQHGSVEAAGYLAGRAFLVLHTDDTLISHWRETRHWGRAAKAVSSVGRRRSLGR